MAKNLRSHNFRTKIVGLMLILPVLFAPHLAWWQWKCVPSEKKREMLLYEERQPKWKTKVATVKSKLDTDLDQWLKYLCSMYFLLLERVSCNKKEKHKGKIKIRDFGGKRKAQLRAINIQSYDVIKLHKIFPIIVLLKR